MARTLRQHHPDCVLCLAAGASRRDRSTRGIDVVKGATWVAHARCWRYMLDRAAAHPATGLLSPAEREQVCRGQLTRMAPHLYRTATARRA